MNIFFLLKESQFRQALKYFSGEMYFLPAQKVSFYCEFDLRKRRKYRRKDLLSGGFPRPCSNHYRLIGVNPEATGWLPEATGWLPNGFG
jgi:hypothetical protein